MSFWDEVNAAEFVDDLVSLLTLCQYYRSKQDGVARPAPQEAARYRDVFSVRIMRACKHAQELKQLLPVLSALMHLGSELEQQGLISIHPGDCCAEKTLNYLVTYIPGVVSGGFLRK
jgi:hypothetical protein